MRTGFLRAVSIAALIASGSSAIAQQVIFRATPQLVEPATAQLSFTAKTGLAIGQQAVSSPAAYTGPALTATASGGEIRICVASDCSDRGTSGWAGSGSVSSGRYVQARRAGPTSPGQTVRVAVSVQNLVAEFVATASGAQPSLDPFAEATAPASGSVVSGIATFSGQYGAALSIANGEYLLCKASSTCGTFTTAAGTIDEGDTLQLRASAPSTSNTSKIVTVSAGLASGSWTVRSAKDTTPNSFQFTAKNDAAASAVVDSLPVALTGHDGVTLTISGGTSSQYRVCTDSACSAAANWTAAASDVPADTASSRRWVQLRTTAGAAGTTSTATLVAGETSGTWSVTAVAAGTQLSAILTDQTLASTVASFAGGSGWTLCASTSAISTFIADIKAKCSGPSTLIVQKTNGIQYGAYVASSVKSLNSGGYSTLSGFYYTGIAGKNGGIYNLQGQPTSAIATVNIFSDPTCFGMQPGFFCNSTIYSYASNGAWTAGYTLDGNPSGTATPAGAAATIDVYRK
jgi:hypothetical protein